MKIPAALLYVVLGMFCVLAITRVELAAAMLGAFAFATASVMALAGVSPADWIELREL